MNRHFHPGQPHASTIQQAGGSGVPSFYADTGVFDYWSRGEVYPDAATVSTATFDYWSHGELLPEVA